MRMNDTDIVDCIFCGKRILDSEIVYCKNCLDKARKEGARQEIEKIYSLFLKGDSEEMIREYIDKRLKELGA